MLLKKFLDKTKIKASEMVSEVVKEGTKMTIKDFEPIIKVGMVAIGLLIAGSQNRKAPQSNSPVIIYNYCYDPDKKNK